MVIAEEGRKLPEGWKWVRLGEVCGINPKRDFNTRNENAPTTFIPMQAIDERKGVISRSEIKPYSEVKKGYTFFRENDVLFAKITPCMQNGKHAVAQNLIDKIGFGSTEFHVIRPTNKATSDWIHAFIRQPSVLKEAMAYFTGAVGQQRVPASFLENLQIPLPPLPEQKRIAAILKEQMAAVEKAKAAAEAQLEAAKALPTAYLREVFTGDVEKKLPEGWKWARLGEVVETKSGGTPPRGIISYYGGSIPWVKSGELNDGLISKTEEMITEEGVANSSAKIFPAGTLLIALYGATVGRLGILEMDAATNQAVCGIFTSDEINRDFLYYYLLKERNQLLRISFGGAQPNISQDIVRKLMVPLPPLSEQKRIAAILKEQMSEAEKLRKSLEEQLETINKIPAALLQRAFSGEL